MAATKSTNVTDDVDEFAHEKEVRELAFFAFSS